MAGHEKLNLEVLRLHLVSIIVAGLKPVLLMEGLLLMEVLSPILPFHR